ncbi:MAG: DUF222 domain-containing protein [bacterium]
MDEVAELPRWLADVWADADAAFDADSDRWAGEVNRLDWVDVRDSQGAHQTLEPRPAVLSAGEHIDADMSRLAEAIDRLVALEAAKASIEAEQANFLAALSAPEPDGDRLLVDELRCALRISATAARVRLETARLLTTHLPVTLDALADGRCSWRHAQAAIDAVTTVLPALDAQAVARLDRVAAKAVSEETTGGVRRVLARAVIAVDLSGADRRHDLAYRGRRVCVYGESDAMASLVLTSSATDVAAVYATLDAAARGEPTTDPRSMDARRADALVDAILRAAEVDVARGPSDQPAGCKARTTGTDREGMTEDAVRGAGRGAGRGGARSNGPQIVGRGARIEVTVSASTLTADTDEPGYLAGYGPIPAGLARRVAAEPNSTWRRLVTDPISGALLDYGRRTYRPPADLRDFVTARDRTCAFPGCAVPARICDLDHIEPYGLGPTAPDNLAPLCRRHHRAKTRQGFSYRRERDGSHRWTMPSGHHYVSRPPTPWAPPF